GTRAEKGTREDTAGTREETSQKDKFQDKYWVGPWMSLHSLRVACLFDPVLGRSKMAIYASSRWYPHTWDCPCLGVKTSGASVCNSFHNESEEMAGAA